MALPLQFNYIPYPVWRKQWPAWMQSLLSPLWDRLYPHAVDAHPPQDAVTMADVLMRYRLLPHLRLSDIHAALEQDAPLAETRHLEARNGQLAPPAPIRLPAQWEPMESIIVTWPIFYPPLWNLHAQLVEAIAPVCPVTVTIPAPMWGKAAWLYLQERGLLKENAQNVTLAIIPTDDVWVRDYGPIVGLDADGQQVALDAIYDHQPRYPQTRDDAMPRFWSAYTETPLYALDLHTEGGNLITDGAGTLLMTERIFEENPRYDRASLEAYLHQFFVFDKLILTPRLALESTGHIDLMLKLARADTVLISAATARRTESLAVTRTQFERETNAAGSPYHIRELPTPQLYRNWFNYPIRRSYTNSLIVNGRVLVPVYGVRQDDEALRIYADAMPDVTVVPIDCKISANGGGAIHCLTKEVPAAQYDREKP